jgi:hypothetical protein
MSIYDLNKLYEAVTSEKLDIAVVSYGGSSTNTLIDTLEKNGYKCHSPVYDNLLCHCPEPVDLDIPIIYIFRNPIEALLSMKRRGKNIWDINQRKLSNSLTQKYSDRNLLHLMIRQFNNWTSCHYNNILFLRYDDIFKPDVVDLLKKFLKNDNLLHFPINFIRPHITNNIVKTIDKRLHNLFDEYEDDIKKINDFPTKINKK